MSTEQTVFTNSKTSHGTTGGYALHGRRRETPCTACTVAKREYDQKRRLTYDQREKLQAYNRAMGRLRELHRAEFDRLWAEEKAR